jgi:hypothetical protein
MSPADIYISSQLDDGLLLARPTDDRLFLLNGTARFMWEMLIDGVVETKVPRLVAARYGIDIAQARKDFQKMLRRWRAEGLIRPTAARHRYEIAGLAFDIHYRDADVAGVLVPMLMHLAASSDMPSQNPPGLEIDLDKRNGKILLRVDGIEMLRTVEIDEIVEKLTFYLFQYASAKVDWLVSVHAAAVGNENECVLIPGASGSGKSSLAAALLSLPNTKCLTDDLALLARATLAVVPVPMPLVLKSGSWNALHPFLPDLAASIIYRRFGKDSRYWAPPRERIAHSSLPVRAVVFPRYVEGADALLSPVTPLEAMSRITAAPCAVKPPITEAVVDQLASFARRVPAYALTYGALSDARRIVWDMLQP